MNKQQRRRREFSMQLPAPLPYPKGKHIKVNPSELYCFRGETGRDFRIWPESHQAFYWTTEYDETLKKRVYMLKVIPK